MKIIKKMSLVSLFLITPALADDCSFVCKVMSTASEQSRCYGNLKTGYFQKTACAVCEPKMAVPYDPNCLVAIQNKQYAGSELVHCKDVMDREGALAGTACLMTFGKDYTGNPSSCDFNSILAQTDRLLNAQLEHRSNDAIRLTIDLRDQLTRCKVGAGQ